MKKLLILLLLLTGCGSVTDLEVLDGDTFIMDGTTYRLAFLDCPEMAQPFGPQAKEFTEQFLENEENIEIIELDIDIYGRTIAIIVSSSGVLNEILIREGFAWVYFSSDANLISLQDAAESTGLNIWSDSNPTPPWEFRKSSSQASP